MFTSYQFPDLAVADSVGNVMSLGIEQLQQCAWLSALEASSSPSSSSSSSLPRQDSESAAPPPPVRRDMPSLTQLAACTNVSATAYAAAIQQFALDTAAAVLQSETEGDVAAAANIAASATIFEARSALFARALRRLQHGGTDRDSDATLTKSVSPRDVVDTSTASAQRDVKPSTNVSIRDAASKAEAAPTGMTRTSTEETPKVLDAGENGKEPLSPCTNPASFSGSEIVGDETLAKPPYMTLFLKDDTLGTDWLVERLSTNVRKAQLPHDVAACDELVEALVHLVPCLSSGARALDALLLLFTQVLSAPCDVDSAFTRKAQLPMLYALPLLPWRADQLPTLTTLLATCQLAEKSTTPSSSAAAGPSSGATTAVRVRMQVWGPPEALVAAAQTATETTLGTTQGHHTSGGGSVQPQADSRSPSLAAADTDSDGFFEIPETGQHSSAPYSVAEEAEASHEDTDATTAESAQEDGDDDFEDVVEETETDEESAVTAETMSNDAYSFGSGSPGTGVSGTTGTSAAAAAVGDGDASTSHQTQPTAVSLLAAVGPVQRVTVRVEHVASRPNATIAKPHLSLLLCPLPASGDELSPAPPQLPAAIALPLKVGEIISCAGPCRVVASATATREEKTASRSSRRTSLMILVEANLTIALALAACKETLAHEYDAAHSVAQAAVATRLLRQVKRDITQRSANPPTTATTVTATTSGSAVPSSGASAAKSREDLLELLRCSLKTYATADAVAAANKAAADATAALQSVADDRLRQQVRCLAADLPAVRATLRIAAYVLWDRVFHHDDQPRGAAGSGSLPSGSSSRLDWTHKDWKEVIRRVHSASSNLGRCLSAELLATFVLDEVMPYKSGSPVTPKQVVLQIQQVFNAAASPDVLRQALVTRHATAVTTRHLLETVPSLLERQPATAAAIVVELLSLLTVRSTSSTTATTTAAKNTFIPTLSMGCGLELESHLTASLHTTVLLIVRALGTTLDAMLPLPNRIAAAAAAAAGSGGHPVCGVLTALPETTFLVLALAVLVLRRDAREAIIADTKHFHRLMELLPGAVNIDVVPSVRLPSGTAATASGAAAPASSAAVTPAKAIEEAERASCALNVALEELAVTSELAETGAEIFDGAEPELVTPLELGCTRTGPLEYLTAPTTATMEPKSLPRLSKLRSSEPVLFPGTHRLYDRMFNVEFQIHRLHTTSTVSSDGGLWLGLTPLPPTRSVVELLNDNKAVLVRPRGEAQVEGHVVPFPAFGEGDTVRFELARGTAGVAAAAMEPCVMVVSLNGVEVLTLPAPKDRLYLILASTEEVTEASAVHGAVTIKLRPTTIAASLPLAAVHRGAASTTVPFVMSHQGTISSSSLPNKVRILSPASSSAAAAATAAAAAPPPPRAAAAPAPSVLKALGFASHVLHYLLLQAHNVLNLARAATASGNMSSPTPWRHDKALTAGATSQGASSEACAQQLVSWAPTPLARRLRQLLQCLDTPSSGVAAWHQQGADRRVMARWVSTRCRAQLCNALLETTLGMTSLILRVNASAVDAASALVDVVAAPAASERAKSLALASLLSAVQSSSSGSGGFGLFALDPSKLWAACVPLAVSVHALGYRPRFSTTTVDSRIAVAAGGRRVEYKTQLGSGSQPTANYAEEGIPLDGSLGDVVTFSVRLQRGYRLDSLCRHYHIGVACCRPQSIMTTLHAHPGDRNRQAATYTLSDYFNDAPEVTRAELRRHHLHWMSSDIVYGSGDVITVIIHTRRRTIGFARNGKYLGTLYRNLPSSVCVLFPFVELINRDSKGKWMHPVREVALYARSMLRAMLSFWWTELTPKLLLLIEEAARGDSTGLEILGSDGNELAMVYRAPPPSEGGGGLQNVRLVRVDGGFSIVEPDGSTGATTGLPLRVWTAALEPLFTAELPVPPPVVPFVQGLLRATRAMAPRENHSVNSTCAFVLHPGAFLRALRLLSTVNIPRESELASAEADESETDQKLRREMQDFVYYLIWLLQAKSTYVPMEMGLIEAFNEAAWMPRDDTVLPLTFATALAGQSPERDAGAAATQQMTPRLCPDCGEPWSTCTAGHAPPESVAALCDRVLHRLGQSSPFTGWVTSWVSFPAHQNEQHQQQPRDRTDDDEEAAGEPPRTAQDDDGEQQQEKEEEDATTEEETEARALAELCATDMDAAIERSDAAAVPEDESGDRDGNYPVQTATVLTVRPDDQDESALRVSCRCKFGSFEATVNARSAVVMKGRVTFQQSGWVDEGESGGVPPGEWSCEACTFVNEPGTTRCAICTTARPGAVWTCSTCTYAFNSNSSTVCATCGQLRYAGLTRLIGRGRDDNVSFCETCHATEEYATVRTLRRRRFCTACAKVTTWLPKRKYVGTMELRLSDRGDVADLVIHVDKVVLSVMGLTATAYSTAQLSALVQASDPATPLSLYVPPIAPLRDDPQSGSVPGAVITASPSAGRLPTTVASLLASMSSPSGTSASASASGGGGSGTGSMTRQESHMRTAIIYYASLISLKWAPLMDTNLFASPSALQRVRVFDESWLAPLDDLSAEDARVCMQACFGVLFFGLTPSTAAAAAAAAQDGSASEEAPSRRNALLGVPAADVPAVHVVATTAAVARALIRHRPALQPLRSAVLYALARIAAAVPADTACREVCCTAITKLFEDAPLSPVNVHCLNPIHALRPMVPGQRRCIVFSLLHGARLESPLTSTTATCCLVKAIDSMTRAAPVPAVLDMDVVSALPYAVALAETTLNEGGDLQVGQVRGSLGVAPTTGGKYYYEVVLPSNFDDSTSNMIVMGWGTQQHEHLSSTQHVGSDLHSWGFNCRDRLRLMMSEQLLPTSQTPTAGDVIGSMMDLSTMMVCWTINGEEIMWVSVPSQGDSEKIYPYVSASVEPCGVEVRLAHTQFRPDDYQDYSAAPTEALWGHTSTAAPPQSYAFYCQLCTFLSEAGISELDMTSAESVGTTLASSRKAQQELRAVPAVRAVVQPTTNTTTGRNSNTEVQWALLNPYIAHLRAVSHLAVLVTQVFNSVKASPFLTEMYDKARDLFLSGVRWTIFESQIGIRPTFSVRPPMSVEIDLEKAKAALQRVDAETFVHDPATRFADSVAGQLFAQTKLSRIYKNAAMFAVKLAGDVAVDGGGVTRSVLSMIADELTFQMYDHQRVDPAVPLFKLCGHSTIFTVVPNMELILGEAPLASSSSLTTSAPSPASGTDVSDPSSPPTPAPSRAMRAGSPDVVLAATDDDVSAVPGSPGAAAAAAAAATASAQWRQEQAAQALQALTWLGRIIGNITLCGTLKLPLVFPRLVWKFLTFKEVTMDDYFYDIDDTVRGALEDEDFLMDDELYYTIPGVARRGSGENTALGIAAGAPSAEAVGAGSSATEMESSATGIFAGGFAAPRGLARGVSVAAFHPGAASSRPGGMTGGGGAPGAGGGLAGLRQARFLTPAASMQNMSRIMTAMSALDDMEEAHTNAQTEELRQRLEVAQQALLHQFDPALQAIRTGLTSVIPAAGLKSIRWDDLQTRVCGSAHCSADQILTFMDCTRIPDDLKVMLTTVLDDFNDKQRALFLLFCAGQSRLPLPEQISVTVGDDASQLPTAHTCSPISLRLQPYTSAGQLRKKLEVCLQNAKQFGFV